MHSISQPQAQLCFGKAAGCSPHVEKGVPLGAAGRAVFVVVNAHWLHHPARASTTHWHAQ